MAFSEKEKKIETLEKLCWNFYIWYMGIRHVTCGSMVKYVDKSINSRKFHELMILKNNKLLFFI